MKIVSKFTVCPVCKSKNYQEFHAMENYALLHCLDCGMVWDPQPPANLESLYSEKYFVNENPKGGYANYFEGMGVNKRTFYEMIKRINLKSKNKEKMLDIGSALGDSLIEARKLGWKKLYGVELSGYAANWSKKRGLNIELGDVKLAKFPANYFDVITIQDVIEHVKKPESEINEVYRILKPSGFVFIVTPDVGGLWHKLLGQYWYHYKPGEHIMYFSQKTLRKLLEQTNFRNIKTRITYHIMSMEYIFNRLRYYSPWLFGSLLKLSKNNFFGKLSFKVYTGEIEGWGQK
jgi:ubiquinone/menaquinone biosynthesis C-methylase UbiE